MDTISMSNWIIPQEDYGDICPIFKKNFKLTKEVETAVIMMSALGVYEPCLNGKRLGESFLMPGWTSYGKRIQVQCFDVKSLLQEENEMIVLLGRGWCAGRIGWSGAAAWQDTPALIGTLALTYKDGSREVFITDKDWEATKSGILFSEIYDGETFDSNAAPSDWQNCRIYNYTKETLIPQEGEEIRESNHLKPVELLTTPNGETVIDFGQNLTGYVNFTITGKQGDVAKLQHAEVLDKDGNFYTANLRTAKQEITYICDGKTHAYKPHFTFQGFRYIKLIDWPEAVEEKNFVAVAVHSDMKRTGHFECSNAKLNKLYSNIIWGQKGNFLDVPTDCPQRDERLGWTGDAQAFIRAASYNFDVNPFFTKWLHDLKADQFEDGGVPAVIPDVLGKDSASSSAWGDAAVICPWQLYLTYGNKKILEEQFASMEKWIQYIRAQGESEYLWNTGHHFGDWLGLDAAEGSYEGSTDKGLIATAFFAYSTGLFVKAGKVLGKDMTAYETLQQQIKNAFQETYLPDGKLTSHTQTAHVLALYFDLCENKKEIAKELATLIQDNGDCLTTGFVGTPYLLHALSDNGYESLAYSLLLQEKFPSWLYSVNMGATTIWEHWDGMRPDGSMWSTDMNSFNHYAYGAVADWMYGVMAGIKQTDSAGFEHFVLQPIADKRISWVKASLQTKNGTIRSSWKRENGKVTYTFEVPTNCTADICLEKKVYHVRAGTYTHRV